ncbi:hypothetical protein [Gemmata sp.]|uniref:hypothetical protein n=1 Tax=Gemmata sp. TaxID=1914242 RepID=UPI003F6F8C00
MSFRDFTFPDVLGRLGLTARSDELNLDGTPVPVPPYLAAALIAGLELSQGIHNEKARSEFVIAPLLLELRRMHPHRFGLFSGTELSVDPEKGLNGVCDFLFTRGEQVFVVEAPIVAIAEAKNDNVYNGYGQCIAAMHAAALFNLKANSPVPAMFGVSTTGAHWKFLRLTGATVTIDKADYFIDHPERVLGALSRVIEIATA